MILAGTRPPEYAAAIRAERARRTSGADPTMAEDAPDDERAEQPVSAVDIAPRPPSDQPPTS